MPEKTLIQTHGAFWLSRTDEEIPWEKIAGYHCHSGWFWDSVEIQTRGQRANTMTCLPKDKGVRIKGILERMKEQAGRHSTAKPRPSRLNRKRKRALRESPQAASKSNDRSTHRTYNTNKTTTTRPESQNPGRGYLADCVADFLFWFFQRDSVIVAGPRELC